ncbi:PTS sugar transporter subunit IIA [Terrarubrum flagellatum]|uniref:PTS sugar transporter subunit IIA n=1 Tax=Terrirubrum flagellatum TaxID=2895980 RepID=UPI003144E491
MKISDFLAPGDAAIDVRASSKRQLLEELSAWAGRSLASPKEPIFSTLMKREELGSTGMGGGFALPHARLAIVKKPFGLCVRLKRLLDFDAIDGEPVDLVFLLLLPASAESEQLPALASVARTLRAPDRLAQLRRARNALELYEFIVN